MSPVFSSLFHEHGAAAFAGQVALADLIGEDYDWGYDTGTGQLEVGDGLRCTANILGTESEASGTWMWSWANPSIAAPAVIQDALALKTYGEQHGVPEFTAAQFATDEVSGHMLSLVAVGLLHAQAYFSAPYDGGAAYLMLRAPELSAAMGADSLRFANVFMEFIQAFPCHHRTAFLAYARHRGYTCSDQGHVVTCTGRGDPLAVTFDAQGRLTDVRSTLHP